MPRASKTTAPKKPTKKKATGGIASRIQSMGEREIPGMKVNVYGQSGTGKTRFWSTWPQPTLVILASGGDDPGELISIDTPANRKGIDELVIQKLSDINELVEAIKSGELNKYETVVLDHASGLQDIAVKELLGLENSPVQMGWGTASQQQWGQIGLAMKEALRHLLGLKQNVLIIAQQREFNVDNESDQLMPYVASALSPSVVGWLNPAVDYIVQTYKRNKVVTKTKKIAGKEVEQTVQTDEVEYCLRVGPHSMFTTKFRTASEDELPGSLVNPTYDKFVALVK